ncbi:MAG: hypothetical protein NVS3B25_19000 [Hymenobacter sp.]
MNTPKATKEQAIKALSQSGIYMNTDYHELHRSDVDTVLRWAAKCRYYKPKNANGSRARYFFESLQRVK